MAKTKQAARESDPAVAHDKEEEAVLLMYRGLSRWEKNAVHIVMSSLSFGQMDHEKTDHFTWDQTRRMYPLPAPKKGGRP